MVIEQKTVIGGEIVGIGKIRADGSEEFTQIAGEKMVEHIEDRIRD